MDLLTEDEQCTSLMWFERFFLIFSNIIYLFTPFYCILLWKFSPKVKFSDVLLSILLCTYVAICSGLYHACDDSHECTKMCITKWQYLYNLDFFGSYLMLPVTVAWWADFQHTYVSWLYVGTMAIESILYIVFCKDCSSDTEIQWYGIIIGQAFLFFLGYSFFYWWNDQLCKKLGRNFGLIAGALSLTFTIVAIVFKFSTPNEKSIYWWMHSVWHLCSGIGIFFAHVMRSWDPLCCRSVPPDDFEYEINSLKFKQKLKEDSKVEVKINEN